MHKPRTATYRWDPRIVQKTNNKRFLSQTFYDRFLCFLWGPRVENPFSNMRCWCSKIYLRAFIPKKKIYLKDVLFNYWLIVSSTINKKLKGTIPFRIVPGYSTVVKEKNVFCNYHLLTRPGKKDLPSWNDKKSFHHRPTKNVAGSNAAVAWVWRCWWLRFLTVLRDYMTSVTVRNWCVCKILMTG